MLRLVGLVALCAVIYWWVFANASVQVADSEAVQISTLLASPSRYDGKAVNIHGVVTGAVGLLGVGGYYLRDPSVDEVRGEIFVLSGGGGVPTKGEEVTAAGRFRQAFTIGARQLPVLVAGL
jgi:hypothetical protein